MEKNKTLRIRKYVLYYNTFSKMIYSYLDETTKFNYSLI